MSDLKQWTNTGGPRKAKPAAKAIKDLSWLKQTHVEISGVKGVNEYRSTVMVMFLGKEEEDKFPEFRPAWDAFGEKFDWTLTNDNCDEVLAEAKRVHAELYEQLPEEDNTRTPDEDADRVAESAKRNDEYKAAQAIKADANAKAKALMPASAKRYVVAEYYVDESDSMTDYFNTPCKRRVLIGFSASSREHFGNCRKAAVNYPPTKELAEELDKSKSIQDSHIGNYLGFGGCYTTGWRVNSFLDLPTYGPGVEIAEHLTAEKPEASAPKTTPVSADYDLVEAFHTKRNKTVFIAVPKERTDSDTFNDERARCKAGGGWYSRKWGKTPGGFAFTSEESCLAFMQRSLVAVEDEADYTTYDVNGGGPS